MATLKCEKVDLAHEDTNLNNRKQTGELKKEKRSGIICVRDYLFRTIVFRKIVSGNYFSICVPEIYIYIYMQKTEIFSRTHFFGNNLFRNKIGFSGPRTTGG